MPKNQGPQFWIKSPLKINDRLVHLKMIYEIFFLMYYFANHIHLGFYQKMGESGGFKYFGLEVFIFDLHFLQIEIAKLKIVFSQNLYQYT